MEVKLKLKVKDVELELSEKDAIELRDTLVRLTGGAPTTVIHDHHWLYDWTKWYQQQPKQYEYPGVGPMVWCSVDTSASLKVAF